MRYAEELAQLLAPITPLSPQEIISVIETPPRVDLGELSFPCFSLAKQLKKAPHVIAQELAEQLKPTLIFSSFRAEGPYLNAFVSLEQGAKDALQELTTLPTRESHIVLEYPSPNTNKPLHLGHLRNMLLGSSLAKIKQFAGERVTQVNLYNDRGIHICKSMLAYQERGNNEEPSDLNMRGDEFVGHWYVKFSELAEENPEYMRLAQETLQLWENEDDDTRKIWQTMNEWCYEGHNHTYDRLGITHKKTYYESEIYTKGRERLLAAEKEGILSRDEKGNLVADLGKYGQKIVLRADGTSIYITQDVELAFQKEADWGAQEYYSIVGDEQQLHFEQLRELLILLKHPHAENVRGYLYGMIRLPSGKMKSREGTVVDAEELLDELKEMAQEAILERHEDIPKEELEQRGEILAQAAIRYFILKYEPTTSFVFDPKETLSFEGETGPYILYALARIHSIIDQIAPKGEVDVTVLDTQEEWELIRTLLATQEQIEVAAEKSAPHIVARHAMTIAQTFTSFYHTHSIKDSEAHVATARLALIRATKHHLELLLSLLGIESLQNM